MNNPRIQWIDCYKAIVIILVVVGHATSRFNAFIYQFHMAAFFFISGYLSRIKERPMSRFVIEKAYRLFLPLLTNVVAGAVLMEILSRFGFSDTLFDLPFPGLLNAVYLFFSSGDVYIQYLGATWFLLALFGVFLLQKSILILCKNNVGAEYALYSISLYLFGYYLVKHSINMHLLFFPVDLICLGQVFFFLGIISNSYGHLFPKGRLRAIAGIICLVICICVSFCFAQSGAVVDYPSRRFNNPLSDILMSMCGVVIAVLVSVVISKIFPAPIRRLLCILSENSMAIMFYHFLFFKLCFLVLWKMGYMKAEEIRGVTPPYQIGHSFWWGIAAMSIAGSIVLWRILCRFSFVRKLLGAESKEYYESYIQRISSGKKAASFRKRHNNWLKRVTNACERINHLIRACLPEAVIVITYILLIMIPMYQQSITVNDEVKVRLNHMKGFGEFYKADFNLNMRQGRILTGLLRPLFMWTGFWGQTNTTFRIAQVISMLICVILFSILIKKLLCDIKVSVLTGLMIVSYIPVSFEHTQPNAFMSYYNIPFTLLLISLLLYLEYLNNDRKAFLVISGLLLFAAETVYEAFVAFLPVYIIILLYKKGIKSLKQNKVAVSVPILVSFCYLVLYILLRMIYPSSYSGTSIDSINPVSSLSILLELLLSSFPGRLLYSDKYNYLYEKYRSFSLYGMIRIVLLVMLLIYLLVRIERDRNDTVARGIRAESKLLAILLFICILPSLPISIAGLYQNNVGEGKFLALPVTFFSFFVSCLFCSIVFHRLWIILSGLLAKCLLLIAVIYPFVIIQDMNQTFAAEQERNFASLCEAESFVRGTMMKSDFAGMVFDAEDLFETKNALSINDSYWDDYASVFGCETKFKNADTSSNYHIDRIKDDVFHVWFDTSLIIASKKPLKYAVVATGGSRDAIPCENGVQNSEGWFEYYYSIQNGFPVTVGRDDVLSIDALSRCHMINGYYDDGWISDNWEFNIDTAGFDTLEFVFYNPQPSMKDDFISVLVDGVRVKDVPIQQYQNSFVINLERDKFPRIVITSSFKQRETNGDVRDLSLLLTNMYAGEQP